MTSIRNLAAPPTKVNAAAELQSEENRAQNQNGIALA
jgi:hypothetical protein